MVVVETLCAKCGRLYQTDLSTLSDKEEDDYASERQRAVAAAGSHWRLCEDCIRLREASPKDKYMSAGFSAIPKQDGYFFVQRPDEKATLLKKLEPGDLDEESYEDCESRIEKMKAETGVWQGMRWKQSGGTDWNWPYSNG